MELLEREEAVARLTEAWHRAGEGVGAVVVVSGEAGVGKTSLVRTVTASFPTGRVLWGACDDLVTPRPLGPFHDIARQASSRFEQALREPGGREAVLHGLLDELEVPPRPPVVVVEDLHWADEATLDLVASLSRRVAALPALLVLTLRSEEVPVAHPLTAVLGSIPPDVMVRVDLAPLSVPAVTQLAKAAGLPPAELYRATAGNPFFVTEVLEGGGEIPATVAQAVLARVAKLPPETRQVLELMAVVPARSELWLLDECAPGWEEALEVAEQRQIVRVEPDAVAFRHELARRAIEEALPALRRRSLHRVVLRALIANQADPSAIVHHAQAAGDTDALVAYGPAAARAAVAADAHREAIAHYERLLGVIDRFDPHTGAVLLDEYAGECWVADRYGQGVEALHRAIDLFRQVGDVAGQAQALGRLSRLHWAAARTRLAHQVAREAVELLQEVPEGPAHAVVYDYVTALHMLDWNFTEAVEWGERPSLTPSGMGCPSTWPTPSTASAPPAWSRRIRRGKPCCCAVSRWRGRRAWQGRSPAGSSTWHRALSRSGITRRRSATWRRGSLTPATPSSSPNSATWKPAGPVC